MWFENQEDEKTQNAGEDSGNGRSGAAAEGNPFAAPGKAFPSSMDPTKAFDDDAGEVPGGPVSAGEISSLKATIKELDEKANLNYDRYLRALAELENYKKRAARERTDLVRFAGEDLLMEILPVVDNLERTLAHLGENTDIGKVKEGIGLVYRQFVQSLEKSGVSRIEDANRPFDPAIHQALQRVDDNSRPDDTVVEILQKGYVLNGKVVRPAMVKVSKHT